MDAPSTDAASGKQHLRASLLAARRAMSDAERQSARAAVCGVVLAQASRCGWRRVAAFEPMRTEPGSVSLLSGLSTLGVEVLVPVTQADRDLDWTAWGAAAGVLGRSAIRDVDAVLVPALAVATDGTRLGRGGGSYDRALARVPAGVVVAAVLFVGETVPALPRDPWDVPVSAVVSPAGWRVL